MAMVAVCLKLPSEVWTRHSAAAEKLGVPLATYLRQRLDEKDRSETALAELRALLEERTAPSAPASEEPAAPTPVLVEMLLILRQVGGARASAHRPGGAQAARHRAVEVTAPC